ncbi:hypothetical protein HYC85_002821 [Camellia sinensis]|uniref:Uncharacterized protein n=1 Tax=Camellia sinensis TaxID=4442 RepID=A0A7J7I9D8_CAMSI|nr:hypothetical protein HYC85_002821 [Camellia sinensis]
MLVSGDLRTKLRNIAVSFISTSRWRPDFLCYVQKLSILVMESWREHLQGAVYEEAKKFTLYVMLKYVLDIEPEDSIPLVGVLLDILDILGKLSIMLVSGDLHTKLRNITVSLISTSRSRPDFLCYFTLYVMLKYVLDIEPEDSIPLVGVLLDILDILGKLSIKLGSGDLHTKLRNIAVSLIRTSRSRPDFLCYVQKLSILFTFYVILKYVLDIELEDSLAPRILEDFLTFMNGFVSIPLYVPGTPYAKAVKARGRLSLTLKEIIKEREKRDVGHVGKGDFLDEILQKGDLSDEEKDISFLQGGSSFLS